MVLNEKGLSLGAGRLWGLSTIKTGATWGTCVAPLLVRPSTQGLTYHLTTNVVGLKVTQGVEWLLQKGSYQGVYQDS